MFTKHDRYGLKITVGKKEIIASISLVKSYSKTYAVCNLQLELVVVIEKVVKAIERNVITYLNNNNKQN